MLVDFTKMEGLGNDFIVIDNRDAARDLSPDQVRFLCDRHFGIGADGILMVESSRAADLKMKIYNPDGSQPEMCGNGIRCFALYARRNQLAADNTIKVETPAGIITPRIAGDQVVVDMGKPVIEAPEIPVNLKGRVVNLPFDFGGMRHEITCVSMGNPHCVIFLNAGEGVDVEKAGPIVEKNPIFPRGTNVEFVRVISSGEIDCEVWERGAGRTLACGTGACASVVAGVLSGRIGRSVLVHLPGGDLDIRWEEEGAVIMTGPARFVFTGQIKLPLIESGVI